MSAENDYHNYVTIENENLYVGRNCIASPSIENNNIFGVITQGTETNLTSMELGIYDVMSFCARPVVCLKSNVQLEKQEDNSFKIVE